MRNAQALTATVTRLFDPPVSVAACRIGERTARALQHAELAQTGRMAPARVLEFVAGRVAARAALGLDVSIPMGTDRAPVWPDGWFGTISHAQGWAIAAVSQDVSPGLDIEADAALPRDVWNTVLLPFERAWVDAAPDPGRAARLIFCAKEAAYKAQFPRSGLLFGFDTLSVTVSDADLTAEFTKDAAPFVAGQVLRGRWAGLEGVIVAGFTA